MRMTKYKECSYLPVFVAHSDVYHPTTLRVSFLGGILEQGRYMEYINHTGVSDDVSSRFELTQNEFCNILENIFGFCQGNYEEELVEGGQKARLGGVVFNENRYMGVERMDKDWCETDMASQEVKEQRKWGGSVMP